MKYFLQFFAGIMAAAALSIPVHAETSELRITRQPGLVYLPSIIMEQEKLIEKHAKAAGLGDLKVSWIRFNSGGAATDALLSGNVDLVTSGATNLLLLWAKTGGQVKGVSGEAALPMFLLTRDPAVKSLKDFTTKDKIAVPTVKVSTQAMILQIAAAHEFGAANMHKLDPLTVSLGHPDAVIALASGKSEVNSHFSLPPYQYRELKIPGVHKVISSVDVLGGPASNGVVFATAKFHDANPKTIKVFLAALKDATQLIAKSKKQAAEIYLQATHEKYSVDELVDMMNDPNFVYSLTPLKTMTFADFMYKVHFIKTMPKSWKAYFFPEVHDLKGS